MPCARHARAAAARSAYLGDRPLQPALRATACRARCSARDFRSCSARSCSRFEEIARARARRCRALGVRKIRLTGGEPLLRRELERLVAMLAASRGDRGDRAHHQRHRARRARARRSRGAGLTASRSASTRSSEGVFQRDERHAPRRSRACSRGSRPPQHAGLAPVKVNMVVRRGVNEHCVLADGRALPRPPADPALHRVHGRRREQRLASEQVVPAARDPRARSASAGRSSRCRAEPRGRGRHALRLPRRGGEIGVIHSVSAAVLRRLHARAAVRRRQALHLPVRDARARPARAAARRRRRRGDRAPLRSDLERTRRPLLGAAQRAPAPSERARDARCASATPQRARRRPRIEMSYIGG